jgi:phenylalanyl-tRNA synthetase beta chain
VLRTHPLDGLLGAVATNVRRRQPNARLFEIAAVFSWGAPGAPQAPQRAGRGEAASAPSAAAGAPQAPQRAGRGEAASAPSAGAATAERRWLTIAVTGARGDAAWYRAEEPVDVYDAKGLAEHALAALGVRVRGEAGGRLTGFEPDTHGVLRADDGAVVGEFGEIAASAREAWGIDASVFAAAIDLDAVAARPAAAVRYEPLPRFPAVQRDMAFVASAEQQVAAADVDAALRAEAGPLLRDVTLFDLFRFPDGRRSLAWRLTFQATDRTLTDEEVNAIHGRVAAAITRRFGLVLRTG